jgi:sigma-B regulation protein RsbU (phosphoserine phosphatase)
MLNVDTDCDVAGTPPASPTGPARILVVDDNRINRRILVTILSKQGYELMEASSGEAGQDLATRQHPDLILLDVMMPGKDGYAVCAELKADEHTADIPIIFLSSLSQAGDKIRGLQVGAVDYVTKPFDQGEVLARVRSHLLIRRLTQQLLAANLVLVEKQRHLDEDLRAAADIQRSLIPRRPRLPQSVAMAWRFDPCDQVGGDLFNVYWLDERFVVLYIADVSGHGVSAAMVTVALSQSLLPDGGITRHSPAPGDLSPPAAVLGQLDREYPLERFDKYFTIWYGILDCQTGRLRYSQAGHPIPVLLRSSGTIELLQAGGPIIGLGMRLSFDEGEVQLLPGDRLYLHTDGIVEFENPDREFFGDDRLQCELTYGRGQSLDDSCELVLRALRCFARGTDPQDDVTLAALEFRG